MFLVQSLGGLLLSTSVMYKRRIVFIMNASEKRCSFQRKIFTCEIASFGLFQNRLLDFSGLALKRKVRLTYAQTRAWLQRIEPIVVRRSIVSARLELIRLYFRLLFGFS